MNQSSSHLKVQPLKEMDVVDVENRHNPALPLQQPSQSSYPLKRGATGHPPASSHVYSSKMVTSKDMNSRKSS